jgi:hypothetical protein
MPNAQDGLAKGDNDAEVYCHCGLFPKETGNEVAAETFSFVHLDVDYYDAHWDVSSSSGLGADADHTHA